MIVWLTGQPGAGKTTLANRLEGFIVVDGDDLRELMPNPGYSEVGRRQNIDRAQAIAAFLDREGFDVAVALVAPYRDQREAFKAAHDVLEVYVHTTESRGREQFHTPDYERPLEGFVDIDTSCSVDEAVRIVHRALATAAPRSRMADTSEAR